jgi:hypothetical protein
MEIAQEERAPCMSEFDRLARPKSDGKDDQNEKNNAGDDRAPERLQDGSHVKKTSFRWRI